MALPFVGSMARRRDQLVAVDLGSHSAKAVHLQRKGDQTLLLGYAIVETPKPASGGAPEPPASRLAKVLQALPGKCRQVVLTVGAADSILRAAELPMVPVSDMRTMLKFNAKTYLQQELSDYAFDCYVLPPRPGTKPEPAKPGQKCRVLVGGARNKTVEDLSAAATTAGATLEAVVPELVCPVNAFELAEPEAFTRDAVALVDIGYAHSSICVLLTGELILSRVVGVGGDRLTAGLAESLGTSYSEAEGIKVGLAHEVETPMSALLMPLGRELRASLDFFEHQQDRAVSQVYVSGAAARSDYILQILQNELMVPCKAWDPLGGLTSVVPPQPAGGLEGVASQLPVAVGAALAIF